MTQHELNHQPPTDPTPPPPPPPAGRPLTTEATARLHTIASLYAIIGWLTQSPEIPTPAQLHLYAYDLPASVINNLARLHNSSVNTTNRNRFTTISIPVPGLERAEITLFSTMETPPAAATTRAESMVAATTRAER